MYIIYQETPSSLLKAAILFRLYNGCCINENSRSLAAGDVLDCSSFSLADLRKKHEARYGPLSWLDSKKSRTIASAAHYALRYSASDKTELILSVMLQALEKGPDYVINRVSTEARNFYNRSRRVCMEIHRAYGFVRLIPIECGSHHFLVAKVSFQYQIHDIVINYFSRRNRDTSVFLVDGDSAYFFTGNRLTVCLARELPFSVPLDEFQEYWDVYYDSQFIEQRKNLALARKHIPKKLWSWVSDGNKLK